VTEQTDGDKRPKTFGKDSRQTQFLLRHIEAVSLTKNAIEDQGMFRWRKVTNSTELFEH
jgi:hypothetical protein